MSKRPATRNPVAKSLRSPLLRQRVIADKRKREAAKAADKEAKDE